MTNLRAYQLIEGWRRAAKEADAVATKGMWLGRTPEQHERLRERARVLRLCADEVEKAQEAKP